jgi:hypothetical protein
MVARIYLSLREAEHLGAEGVNYASGFPWGIQIWWIVVLGIILAALVTAWVLTAKGRGSHAGREQVRRAYRRELARQMARQDAEKIRSGEKDRRKWMQW